MKEICNGFSIYLYVFLKLMKNFFYQCDAQMKRTIIFHLIYNTLTKIIISYLSEI